ncbi:MAG: 4Fe-4S ferredoxin [Candidatus Nanoarchaeia archaeon]|nr:4Fe-4S ferredoxin [Candidatus Nanoarchaeia archaeon]
MPRPVINYEKLGKYDEVLEICPTQVFEKVNGKIVVKRPQDCIGCRACEANAPEGAITVVDN